MHPFRVDVECAVDKFYLFDSAVNQEIYLGTRQVVVEKADTVNVLVAGRVIRLGDSIRSGDLKWQAWPKQAAVSGYIIKSKQPA